MPVSVIVGGQYGSEGKGKVALDLVRREPLITTVVRPGGTNSGHTGYGKDGRRHVLRQLPAAAVDRNIRVVLPAGSYIDIKLLYREMRELGISPDLVKIDYRAHVIREEHVEWEANSSLIERIGSTGSGTGAAVLSRLARNPGGFPEGSRVSDHPELQPFIVDTQELLSRALAAGERIVIEGTQGYGLSPLHGEDWPRCTSRDTTAAAFVSEAGLSPLLVDEVVLVLRCHPIRVAGNSGPLYSETTWADITADAGSGADLTEYTSVTSRIRRVGRFDFRLAEKSINANAPTKIVLNHIDYIDRRCRNGLLTSKALEFLEEAESKLNRRFHWLGLSELGLVDREMVGARARAA